MSYIGLDIKRDGPDYVVSQSGYRDEILSRFQNEMKAVPRAITIPAGTDLNRMRHEEEPEADRKKYISILMSLMYLARLTRPDILVAVAYLATQNTAPKKRHYQATLKILRYLASVPNYTVRYKRDTGSADRGGIIPRIYSDASHAFHGDGRGQAGMFITLGSGFIACRSTKLRMVTLSSTESEGVALAEAATYAVWLKSLLSSFGYHISNPVKIYQDNLSTILLSQSDGSFARTKHITVRKYYIREKLAAKDISIIHLSGSRLCADMFTKPLSGDLMRAHMKRVGLEPMDNRMETISNEST